MRVQLLPASGVVGPPITIEATLVIVYDDNDVPVMVAGEYGPQSTIRASHALDKDFNKTLHALGVNRTVICDKLVLPQPPAGARILTGPDGGSRG